MPHLKEGNGQLAVQIDRAVIDLVEECKYQKRITKNEAAELLLRAGWAALEEKGEVKAPGQ